MDLTEFFQCPKCQSPFANYTHESLACNCCKKVFESTDGIYDFVAGEATTQLDQIDYDQFYNISDIPTSLCSQLRTAANGRWPQSFGKTLEIGAGTGGFTMGLARDWAGQCLVVTDVSVKMLRVCRERLNRLGLLNPVSVAFASYDGKQPCIRSGSFDTCVGTSVIHHITDVELFLQDLVRVLSPNGIAFFVEPNRRYHQALSATLADIVVYLLSSGSSASDHDIILMGNLVAEIRCNLLHADDIAFLETREDKHMFIAEEIEATGFRCGFSTAEAIAIDCDPLGQSTLSVYLGQCGVTVPMATRVLALLPDYASRYMRLLSPNEQSPSYLLWFTKGQGVVQVKMPAPRPDTENIPAQNGTDAAMLRCWIDVNLNLEAGTLHIHVCGWCVAIPELAWLELSVAGQAFHFPIWLPRTDVFSVVQKVGIYSTVNALCCGVKGSSVVGSGEHATQLSIAASILTMRGEDILKAAPFIVKRGEAAVISK